MTQAQKNDFLDLFCKFPLSEIITSKQGNILAVMDVDSPEQLSTIEGYGEYYKQVTDIAEKIEKISRIESQDVQTKRALLFLNDTVRTPNTGNLVIMTVKIIKSRLFGTWNQQNQRRYTIGKELLLDWIHFFISYTNSSKPSINNTYKSLLETELEPTYISDNRNKINLMAELLYKYFKKQKINTFYDKVKIDWSDDFKNEIFSYTAKSFAFVQLIDQDIFYGTSNDNYCYKEYLSYTQSISTFYQANQLHFTPVFFFIISNPSNSEKYKYKPAGLEETDIALDKWAEYIKDKQYVVLHSQMSEFELQLKIQDASYDIVALKKNVFQTFINSFTTEVQ